MDDREWNVDLLGHDDADEDPAGEEDQEEDQIAIESQDVDPEAGALLARSA